jgi:para-nitrobenzyl esterase
LVFSYVKRALHVGSLICALASAIGFGAEASGGPPPVVDVQHVRYQGERTPSGGALFRGIPYAQPPVGPLRWKPPQPPLISARLRPAARPAAPCLQADVGWNRADSERSAEDCLYLDIRTPRIASGARLPVLVWIHGGANWGPPIG